MNHVKQLCNTIRSISDRHTFAYRLGLLVSIIWVGWFFIQNPRLFEEYANVTKDTDYIIYSLHVGSFHPTYQAFVKCVSLGGFRMKGLCSPRAAFCYYGEQAVDEMKAYSSELYDRCRVEQDKEEQLVRNKLREDRAAGHLRIVAMVIFNAILVPIMFVLFVCFVADPTIRWLVNGIKTDMDKDA